MLMFRYEKVLLFLRAVRDLQVWLFLEVDVFGHFDPSCLWRLSASGNVQ